MPFNKEALILNDIQNENVNLNDNEIIILNIIKNKPKILRKEIFEIAGISRSTGDRILKKLKESGVLEELVLEKQAIGK